MRLSRQDDGSHYYLSRLRDLNLVERRLPATLTTAQRRRSKRGRYHLGDPYFRFRAPHQQSLRRPEETLSHIQDELQSFVALAFERLAQDWLSLHPQTLPFSSEAIGAHWDRTVQIDVVAVNWGKKEILLGECKWGGGDVKSKVVREMFERKAPRLRKKMGEEWTFHYAFFARQGFTKAATAAARAHDALLIDMEQMDADLHRATP